MLWHVFLHRFCYVLGAIHGVEMANDETKYWSKASYKSLSSTRTGSFMDLLARC